MKKAALIVVLLGALLVWRAVHHSGLIGFELLCGWVYYIGRVLPKMVWRWDAIAVFGLSLLAFAALLHYLLSSLRPRQAEVSDETRSPWRLRWTLCIVAFTLLMFAGGIAMIGATHQATWLLTGEDRVFVGVMKPWNSGATSNLYLRNVAIGITISVDNFQSYPNTMPHRAGAVRHSWVTRILPYMGFSTDEFDYKRSFDDPVNAPLFRRVMPFLINPQLLTDQIQDREGFALSHYAGNSRIFEAAEPVKGGRVANRAAQTILLGEVNADFVPWGHPDSCRDPVVGINTRGGFGGPSAQGGAQFGMADGSVRFISATVDSEVLRALSTPDAEFQDPTAP